MVNNEVTPTVSLLDLSTASVYVRCIKIDMVTGEKTVIGSIYKK